MLRKTLDFIYDAAGYLAAFFVFMIFAIMTVSSIMRETGFKTGGTDDVVSWITAAAAFFGLAHTFKHGDFVRVGLLLEKLGEKPRRFFEILSLTIATVFTGYMAWAVTLYVYDSYQFKDMAGGLVVIPLWIPQISFVVGAVLLFVAFVDELVLVLMGRTPTYVRAVEERHARGDFSEDV
ncbi:MAG TPA: TRAP transporter small permease [Burkholderiales bacterium]|jgi:TRAP-type C4-dicarboxylate transport system permease small subunit